MAAVMILSIVFFLAQAELTGREVSLHNQKLALESVVKELHDTKQTIDRFRCEWFRGDRTVNCRQPITPVAIQAFATKQQDPGGLPFLYHTVRSVKIEILASAKQY